jgi:hypothetical protein
LPTTHVVLFEYLLTSLKPREPAQQLSKEQTTEDEAYENADTVFEAFHNNMIPDQLQNNFTKSDYMHLRPGRPSFIPCQSKAILLWF